MVHEVLVRAIIESVEFLPMVSKLVTIIALRPFATLANDKGVARVDMDAQASPCVFAPVLLFPTCHSTTPASVSTASA